MPLRSAQALRLWRLSQKTPSSLRYCRACALWRISSKRTSTTTLDLQERGLQIRKTSTVTSTTAVNQRFNVPPRNKQLYEALYDLKLSAADYVNPTRLQLALQGLEAQEAPVRIAVLSMDSQRSARKLTRLLLADPLAAEEAWERQLEEPSNGDERALLLRYGDEYDAQQQIPNVKTVSVPSRTLQKNSIEAYISTIDPQANSTLQTSSEKGTAISLLVPSLQTTVTTPSGTGADSFPVHKSIILGDGLQSGVRFGRLLASNPEQSPPARMVKLAIRMPALHEETQGEKSDDITAVDLDTAANALAKFRESIANSELYEHGWFRSGMPRLSDWLSDGLQPTETGMKPAEELLIVALLDDAEATITNEDAKRLEEITSSTISEMHRESILKSVKLWAERAHTELRDQLDQAFTGRNWRKISWWKLFWRVDDVGMITSEILERRWLVDAEKGSIYVAGRIEEAGLFRGAERTSLTAPTGTLGTESERVLSAKDADIPTEALPTLPAEQPLIPPELKHFPTQISLTRSILLKDTIPSLHTLAQQLVLLTASTTSITTCLSALLYISFPSFSLFEAGAVAATGLVFSLRNMQKKWEGMREAWEEEVREEGRKALKVTEDLIRDVVKNGGRSQVDPKGVQERMLARDAVARAREALEAVQKK